MKLTNKTIFLIKYFISTAFWFAIAFWIVPKLTKSVEELVLLFGIVILSFIIQTWWLLWKKKDYDSGVYVKETDLTVSEKLNKNFTNSGIIIGSSSRGPNGKPILIHPKIKPVLWYQFWRWNERKLYKQEVENCKRQIEELFKK